MATVPSNRAARIEALVSMKRWDEAVVEAQAAVGSAPHDGDAITQLAATLYRAGRHTEAAEAAARAVQVAPEREWAYRVSALALNALKRPREALGPAAEAVRLRPHFAPALSALLEAQLGCRHLAGAEATLAELLRIDPGAPSLNAKGRFLLLKRKQKDAEAAFREAIRLDPLQPAYLNNLGIALQRRGRRRQAIEAYRSAASLDPTYEPPRRNLYRTTRQYVWGGGTIVAVIGARALLVASFRGTSLQRLIPGAIAVLFVVALCVVAFRFYAARRLHPSVWRHYRAESARRSLRGRLRRR
jgi:tetratricopeptide (TPR) repeat protein